MRKRMIKNAFEHSYKIFIMYSLIARAMYFFKQDFYSYQLKMPINLKPFIGYGFTDSGWK